MAARPAAQDPSRRRGRLSRNAKRRVVAYGTLALLLYGFFLWIPWEYDLFERAAPSHNPAVDPDRARLFSPGTRVTVVTAHPDDSEFYVGGLLTQLAAAGAHLSHVVVTDGDKAYYPFEDHEQNRRTRRAEQTKASRTWKAREIVFLGFPDGRLRASDEVVERLKQELRRLRPEYVLSFDPDHPPRRRHQDHRKAGIATVRAVREARIGDWLVLFSTSAPNHIFDISDHWDEKERLLAIHESQFGGKRFRFIANMVQDRAVEDGERGGFTYGEGVRAVRLRNGGTFEDGASSKTNRF